MTINGVDTADFAQKEAFAIAIDFGSELDPTITGEFDFIIGYPAGDPSVGPVLPCGVGKAADVQFSALDCFGL